MTAKKAAVRNRPAPRAAAPEFELVLYISGATENSRRALLNINELGEKHLKGRYRLRVVDLLQQPERAARHGVLALPMLVKTQPLPLRRMIGNLSDQDRVMVGLDLLPHGLAS